MTEIGKKYSVHYGIGNVKYSVSKHDGNSKHKDGSPFWDITTFKSLKKMKTYLDKLHKSGYTHA